MSDAWKPVGFRLDTPGHDYLGQIMQTYAGDGQPTWYGVLTYFPSDDPYQDVASGEFVSADAAKAALSDALAGHRSKREPVR